MSTARSQRSIASRIFLIVLAGNLVALGVVLGAAWWSLEGLEQTFIDSERMIELEYFAEYGDRSRPEHIQTAQMVSAYLPGKASSPDELPLLFRDIPVPFEGEVEVQGRDYIIITHQFPEGAWYFAQSMDSFEKQETHAVYLMVVLAVIIILLSLLLAWAASRLIAQPIVRICGDIESLPTDNLHACLMEDFPDIELNTIAHAINGQLQKSENLFLRERALVSMASHELRTPIAVIAGAVNVLESRNQLLPNDRITLGRISGACAGMSANIQALLDLVRRTRETPVLEAIDICILLANLQEEYGWEDATRSERLVITGCSRGKTIHSDPVLVKMLLHNLINNALSHAQGKVRVSLTDHQIVISDEGGESAIEQVGKAVPESFRKSTGMGMYIVNLICDALHWQHEITTNEKAGITVTIHFGSRCGD